MPVNSTLRTAGTGAWIAFACGRTTGSRWQTEQEARIAAATACASPDCMFRHAVVYKSELTVRIAQADADDRDWERRMRAAANAGPERGGSQ
jgi:hypothetical protein